MPWQCSICAAFNADDLQKILNHIGRCHRNDPNFHCICGIDGCALTFRKYYSWRKHIYRKHGHHDQNGNQTEQNDNQRLVANNFNIEDIAPDQDVQDQVKRASALYLLKLQEECKLPKSTVKSVVANTKSIVQETLSVVKTQVEHCLAENEIDFDTVPGLNRSLKKTTLLQTRSICWRQKHNKWPISRKNSI